MVFDLNKLYQQTFGTNPNMRFKKETPTDGVPSGDLKFDLKETDTKKYSQLGTPFYEQIKGDVLGRECFLPVTIDKLKLPFCTIRISSKKTIVETALINRKGSIIEQINVENYNIKMRGFVIGENGELPDEAITELKDLYEKNESVVLRNALSDIFLTADDKIVIKSFDLPEVRGVKNVRPFEFDTVSDSEFTLIVE